MVSVPDDLKRRLHEAGQEHVMAWWDRLKDSERTQLLDQLQAIDLQQLRDLYAHREQSFSLPGPERIAPIPVIGRNAATDEAARLGEKALQNGEVAVLLVAGGQGSRLGFEHPKGMYPIGPASGNSLFQIHAEKLLARARRHGKSMPFLVMTSPSNRAETEEFFRAHRWFGLPPQEVWFFSQGTMPALDLASGRLVLEAPSKLFTSPNGHGGSLIALAETGLLERLQKQGIRHIFYFQVDNPLVKVADPIFLGHHKSARAEVSTKIVPKNGPDDKLGNLVLIDGRCSMIEYSDMPREMAQQKDEQGQLRYWVGSPAIHVFDVDFLARVTHAQSRIPFHLARKKVPYLDASGTMVEPEKENALKFEMFIFDVLPRADRWTVVETSRREEFEPLKNATGPDSPQTVRQAISNVAGDWLNGAGVSVPRQPNGDVAVPLEISPLFALDEKELAGRVDHSLHIDGPTYLHGKGNS